MFAECIYSQRIGYRLPAASIVGSCVSVCVPTVVHLQTRLLKALSCLLFNLFLHLILMTFRRRVASAELLYASAGVAGLGCWRFVTIRAGTGHRRHQLSVKVEICPKRRHKVAWKSYVNHLDSLAEMEKLVWSQFSCAVAVVLSLLCPPTLPIWHGSFPLLCRI